jgi:hypothetical protein
VVTAVGGTESLIRTSRVADFVRLGGYRVKQHYLVELENSLNQ